MTGSDPEVRLPLDLPLDDRPGPAVRLAREQTEALVSAALIEYDRTLAGSRAHGGRATLPRTAATWGAAAGTVVALAFGAAAARYYFHNAEPARPTQPAQPVQAPATPAPLPEPEAPAPEPSAPESASRVGPSALSKPARTPAAERNAPEDLLQKANHQRAEAQFRDAAATYALVYERFPRTESAYAARVAGAAIELEYLSNPTRARHLFEQALRDEPHGALDLEARQGLSVALRDLEDRGAETRALHALIAAHPDSPAARRAQVRLRELGDNTD